MSAQLTVAAYDLRRTFDDRARTVDYCHISVGVLTTSEEIFKIGIEVDGDALANLRATLAVTS